MKNIKQNIFSWAIMATSFFFTLWTLYIAYWALTNLPAKVWTWSWLTVSSWNKIVDSLTELDSKTVPSWAVMAFNLSICPSWWITADGQNSTPDLRWEFIRWWIKDKTWVDDWRTLNTWQWSQNLVHTHIWTTDLAWDHQHKIQWTWRMKYYWWSADIIAWLSPWMWVDNNRWTDPAWNHQHSFTTQSSWWNEARPRNIALLYCMKQY